MRRFFIVGFKSKKLQWCHVCPVALGQAVPHALLVAGPLRSLISFCPKPDVNVGLTTSRACLLQQATQRGGGKSASSFADGHDNTDYEGDASLRRASSHRGPSSGTELLANFVTATGVLMMSSSMDQMVLYTFVWVCGIFTVSRIHIIIGHLLYHSSAKLHSSVNTWYVFPPRRWGSYPSRHRGRFDESRKHLR